MKFLHAYNIAVHSETLQFNQSNYASSLQLSNYSVMSLSSPMSLVHHNERVFQFFQTKARFLSIPYHDYDSFKIYKKLSTLNTRQGFKQKSLQSLNDAFMQVYQLFETYDNDIQADNPAYGVFYNFSRTFVEDFYKPDFFLKYIYTNLELLFLIKKIKPKKKVKKKKNQQKTMVSYLSQKSRVSITTRVINAYLNQTNERIRSNRIRDALIYLVFSGKNSFLYKKKLAMYNKLLEKKKFY